MIFKLNKYIDKKLNKRLIQLYRDHFKTDMYILAECENFREKMIANIIKQYEENNQNIDIKIEKIHLNNLLKEIEDEDIIVDYNIDNIIKIIVTAITLLFSQYANQYFNIVNKSDATTMELAKINSSFFISLTDVIFNIFGVLCLGYIGYQIYNSYFTGKLKTFKSARLYFYRTCFDIINGLNENNIKI